MSSLESTSRIHARRWIARSSVVLIAVVVYLIGQVSVVVMRSGWSVADFRDFFSYDAYGYMAIVKDVADGQVLTGEPTTETGQNFYPHAYYTFLGLIARTFNANPIAVWNVVGIMVQVGLIVVIALVLIGLSGRWWCGLLAPIPLMLGTFSWIWDPGSWYVTLASHAVLWGPFAVLFTLNGEAFALSAGAAMLLALMWLWGRSHPKRSRLVFTVLICLGIGCLANVQTYSFLTTVYVLVFVVSVWGVMATRNWWLVGASAVLVPVVFLLGPLVNTHFGQLPTLVFGLVPAAPGVAVLVIRAPKTLLIPMGALVLGAAPQVVWTVYGIASHDPFLTYRVASNSQLGVHYVQGLISALALVVPLIAVFGAGLLFRNPSWAAYGMGASVAWFLLAFNDRWGANAEPYRLWIDGFTVVSILSTAMLVDVAVGRSGAAYGSAGAKRRWANVATITALVVCACVAVTSSIDWFRFFRNDAFHTSSNLSDPRDSVASALAEAKVGTSPGPLVLTDPCIDPRVLKINSGVPVAYYYIGMAWPRERDAVQAVMDARTRNSIDFAAARAANVKWVVTDSRCRADWPSKYAGKLALVSSSSYADGKVFGRMSLWSIVGAS
ncbi:hypothetical protein [Humibacter ginsengiterrae]